MSVRKSASAVVAERIVKEAIAEAWHTTGNPGQPLCVASGES
jgi:hypothetical protein